jgi:hypothetical protein
MSCLSFESTLFRRFSGLWRLQPCALSLSVAEHRALLHGSGCILLSRILLLMELVLYRTDFEELEWEGPHCSSARPGLVTVNSPHTHQLQSNGHVLEPQHLYKKRAVSVLRHLELMAKSTSAALGITPGVVWCTGHLREVVDNCSVQ